MPPTITENNRRKQLLITPYDPHTGQGCATPRTLTRTRWEDTPVYLPDTMLADPDYRNISSRNDYITLRHRHDFEYWAATCVNIRHKVSGSRGPLILNAPQRRVVAILEADRLAGRPIRLVMLKARQWGGSTLIQMYFAWIQTVHRLNWHSLICAQHQNTASTIRAIYSAMLREYPEQYWQGDTAPRFSVFEGSRNTREITGRGCNVTISSAAAQEATRGLDCAMAHLSEVAFWKDTDNRSPVDFIRAVCGGIPYIPYSMIVLESTANGVGNYFHLEWLRACSGESNRRAIFVPWYEIEMYRMDIPDPEAFIRTLNPYELSLWDRGLTLEMIYWYRHRLDDIGSSTAMQAEYPTTPEEAFVATNSSVFNSEEIERLRAKCTEPLAPEALSTQPPKTVGGTLKIWAEPAAKVNHRNRYVAVVDIGGRSAASDWSVIAIFDRFPDAHEHTHHPTIVAQWRGHCDHHLLAAQARALAQWYHDALLVVESNTFEAATESGAQYLLEELNSTYRNMYIRTPRDTTAAPHLAPRVGFHTNRVTKPLVIASLISAVREGMYTERDADACNELSTYENRPNGAYSARKGHHDDILMTRAIGLYVISTLPITTDTASPSQLRTLLPAN